MNAIGKHFHPECFNCAYCGKLFGNSPFFLEDGLPYCEAGKFIKNSAVIETFLLRDSMALDFFLQIGMNYSPPNALPAAFPLKQVTDGSKLLIITIILSALIAR